MFFWIELILAVLSIAIAYTFPDLGSSWFERAEQLLNRLAQRRGLAIVVVGLAALASRAALLPILPIPQPGGHDDFGYLLLADTFAHGRLTNPTHPMWIHLESFHIIWQPTYTAMFHPAQGLMLAFGQVVFGHPFWGVWLSSGLMCAATCWMLQGWLPPGWALLGGLLAVIRLGTFSYWANSYWGGAVAAIGGALVLGALPRLKRSQRPGDALLMGLGFAILANSRPYEGLFLGLAVAGALATWTFGKNRPPVRLVARRFVAPVLLVLALTGCAMGYYFWRTTGSPWDTPYLINVRTYRPGPFFPWQPVKPALAYHHAVMEDFYVNKVRSIQAQSQTVAGMAKNDLTTFVILWGFYLGPVFSLPVLLALTNVPYGFSWRDISREMRFLLLVCVMVIGASLLPTWFLPHYAAPITGAILALVLRAMRNLRCQKCRGRPSGLFLTRAIPSVCLLLLVLRAGAKPLHLPEPQRRFENGSPTWCDLGPANLERAATLAQLEKYPGRQLAIVRYGPHHDTVFREWVYNEADFDAAKVVWARDMGPARNKELIDYFRDRHVWLVEADDTPPKVSPYGVSP